MRIGIDARAYEWTGIGRYVRNLLAEVTRVAAARGSSIEFVVFAPRRLGRVLAELPGTTVVPVHGSYYSVYEQSAFLARILASRVDLMHFPNFNVPVLYRRPFLVTIHDLTRFHFPGQKHTSRAHQFAYQLVFRSAVRHARHIIAVSAYTNQELVRFFPEVEGRVSVIYEGVDDRFLNASEGDGEDVAALARLGIETPFVLYVGLWMRHKNLPCLIRAFQRLRAAGYPGRLVVTGRGRPWDENVQRLANDHSLGDVVVLPGAVSDDDLPALYRQADVLLFPSLSEGFGFPPLEAMACGTPVVAARAGSLPEILGDAALFADPNDPAAFARATELLARDPEMRERLVERGRERVRAFSWKTCGEMTFALYERHEGRVPAAAVTARRVAPTSAGEAKLVH